MVSVPRSTNVISGLIETPWAKPWPYDSSSRESSYFQSIGTRVKSASSSFRVC